MGESTIRFVGPTYGSCKCNGKFAKGMDVRWYEE
jgi:hypothetical protein